MLCVFCEGEGERGRVGLQFNHKWLHLHTCGFVIMINNSINRGSASLRA